jgi:hypothetical protein
MVVGQRRYLRLVRYAEDLLSSGKFFEFDADCLGHAAADAYVDLVKNCGFFAAFWFRGCLKDQHQPRRLAAGGNFRERFWRFARVRRKVKFDAVEAFCRKPLHEVRVVQVCLIRSVDIYLESRFFQRDSFEICLNFFFEFCGGGNAALMKIVGAFDIFGTQLRQFFLQFFFAKLGGFKIFEPLFAVALIR